MTRTDVGTRPPAVLPGPGREDRRRDAGRLLRQSVQQPGQSARARDHHRPRDLGTNRAQGRRGRVRRRLGRDAHRTEPLLRPRGAAGRNRSGRSGRIGARRLRPHRPDRQPRARGWSKASAKISCRRSPICRACSAPTASPIARRWPLRGNCCAPKASWPAAARARWWPRRCAIAASRRSRRRVVTFVCDSGNKYLSKMYNDYWMADQGLGDRPAFGDLRDLIARSQREHESWRSVPTTR